MTAHPESTTARLLVQCLENEEVKCGSPEDFQAAYWYFRNRIQIINQVPNLTWVVTYMGNTFRGKHGGPERWWPAASRTV